ncbi:DUF3782 domain-containing protein [Nodosilinea sp. PGN35]|uniref:DUF3782 domain-containing protein n=1 Tax=Nodosilinea sp. PGN35 TaxID=3020489 RepID=UPI0023B22DC8|nr:DUF3782 domain-containing protein [Nodosilinea sp. TSF1-S3]MDF0366350.1 DUF3782 domain-containing protein [Nodosilinea sp. TSF1-S3]
MTTTADDVWRLLGELVAAQQETERRFQETERRFQETERRFQDTDRLLREQSQETERKIRATVEENRQINRQLSQQIGNLGGKWGLFVENMVAPACETLFLERGIPVHQVSQRVRKRENGDTLEIDVLVLNQEHVLAVEVKSTLSVDDVKDFVDKLGRFRDFFPEHGQRQLYGAVAGIGIDPGADRYAYRQGLFVLVQSGETVVILNDPQFQPRTW